MIISAEGRVMSEDKDDASKNQIRPVFVNKWSKNICQYGKTSPSGSTSKFSNLRKFLARLNALCTFKRMVRVRHFSSYLYLFKFEVQFEM